MDIYNSIPEGYYLKVMTKGSSLQRFWHSYHFSQVSAQIPDDPRITLVDLGSGPGSFFFQHKKRARKIGFDVAKSQIKYVKRILPGVRWVCADIEKVNLPKTDYIVMTQVLEHLQPGTEILRNIYRALKKNGRAIITTPNNKSLWPIIEKLWELISPVKYEEQHINMQTIASLKKSAEECGFRVVSTKTLFLFTPFVALLSSSLAKRLIRFEEKIIGRSGLVILVVLEK